MAGVRREKKRGDRGPGVGIGARGRDWSEGSGENEGSSATIYIYSNFKSAGDRCNVFGVNRV
jgi:hypothetical protein